MSFHETFTTVHLFIVVLMHLTLFITVSYFKNSLTVVYLYQFVYCLRGIVLMKVRWEKSSDSFCVSIWCEARRCPPVLFSVYLYGLLECSADSGVGCHWGHIFAGAVCYADDIVLMAPCPSALRILLDICYSFTVLYRFNAEKSQLICFHLRQSRPGLPKRRFTLF